MGVNGDYHLFFDMATNAPTVIGGAQTWKGSGQLYTTNPVNVADSSVWNSLCFWMYAGANEREPEATQGLTVAMGVCGPNYTDPQIFRTFTFTGAKRLWFTTPISAIVNLDWHNLYFFLDVTAASPTQLWWAERAQVDKNIAYPEGHIQTVGHPVYYDPNSLSGVDMGSRTTVVCCPNCADPTMPRTHGPARREPMPPIPFSGGQEV